MGALHSAEVLGGYSRYSVEGHRLVKAHELAQCERRPSAWTAPTVSDSWRVRILLGSQLSALVSDYQAGNGTEKLAAKYGLAPSTVAVHLRRAGIEIRPPDAAIGDTGTMVRLRAKGMSYQQIADHFGITRTAVWRRLNRKRGSGE